MRFYVTYRNREEMITEEFKGDTVPYIGSCIRVNKKFHLVDNVCFDYDKDEVTILTKN